MAVELATPVHEVGVIVLGDFSGLEEGQDVRRTGEDSYEEEDFGAVAFVPLIGEEGWSEA